MDKPVIYTEEDLNKLCKEYQELLRLQDWQVRVLLVDQFTIAGNQAEVSHSLMRKEATISIPTPETYASELSPHQNMEKDLIHELIHLYFSGYQFDELTGMGHKVFEMTINLLTGAIYSLKCQVKEFSNTSEWREKVSEKMVGNDTESEEASDKCED